MSTLSFGMATQARAQTVGCSANGCSQLFGVTGSLSTSYSANYALTTAPSLKITSGWVVAPTGLTNLSQGGLPHYIEAGPIKICSLDCDKIYPYTTAVDLQGIPSFYIHRSSSWSDPGLQRYYGVKYIGNKQWQGFWCDSTCHDLPALNLGQGSGFPFAASGGEGSSSNSYFGSITTSSNRFIYAGGSSYQPWCWSISVKNNLNQGTNSISSCNNASWSVKYLPNTSIYYEDGIYQYSSIIHGSQKSILQVFPESSQLVKVVSDVKLSSRKILTQASPPQKNNANFKAKPLLDASDQEIAEIALEITRTSYEILGGGTKSRLNSHREF